MNSNPETTRAGRAALPVYPVVFSAAVVVHAYIAIGMAVPAWTVLRPLLAAVAISSMVVIALAIALGRDRGGVAALVIPLGFMHLGPPPGATVIMAITPIWLLLLITLLGRRRPTAWRSTTRFLNTLSAMIVIVLLVRWAVSDGPSQLVSDLQPTPTLAAACGSGPNIYVILSDAYPRRDVLQNELGFDNSAFMTRLRSLGMDEYADARSDYPSTILTVTSMFNMGRIEDVPGLIVPRSNERAQQPAFRNALRDNSVLPVAREAGYETVAIESGWDELTLWAADRVLRTGELSQFEMSFVTFGAAGPLVAWAAPSFLGDEKRERIERGLEALPALAREESCQPKLAFAHIPAPHYPLVYEADGEPLHVRHDQLDWFDLDDPQLAKRYVDNLNHLNRLIAEAITGVVLADPEAVIVLMSDHGSLLDLAGPDERYRTLLLARTPGHPHLLGDEPNPIELFPRLFGTYIDSSARLP